VYETTDTDFANRAIEAMRDADIPCYRVGHGYSNSAQYVGRGFSENQVCIYIERDTDYAQANEILVKLGAVTESPGLPPKLVFVLLLFVAVVLGTWVALQWK
jgi:hypothetical protein